MEILLALYVAAGLLLAGLSLPLLWRKIGPNPWYGFRVKRTFEDPAAWYAVNAFAARGLLAAGLGTSAAAALLYFVPGLDLAGYAVGVCLVFLAFLAVGLALSFRFLRRFTAPEDANGVAGESRREGQA
jgi:hypothetical protein